MVRRVCVQRPGSHRLQPLHEELCHLRLQKGNGPLTVLCHPPSHCVVTVSSPLSLCPQGQHGGSFQDNGVTSQPAAQAAADDDDWE